jgi:hypothetical protein
MPRNGAAVLFSVVTFGSLGCGATLQRANLFDLQARAAFDLACPAPWLRLHHLGEHVKGVEGCGRRMTYVERCNEGAACSWTAESMVVMSVAPPPIVVAQPAPPPPPPLPLAPPQQLLRPREAWADDASPAAPAPSAPLDPLHDRH